jgi:hypothetical protein
MYAKVTERGLIRNSSGTACEHPGGKPNMRSNPLADPIGSAINQISNDNDGRKKKEKRYRNKNS